MLMFSSSVVSYSLRLMFTLVTLMSLLLTLVSWYPISRSLAVSAPCHNTETASVRCKNMATKGQVNGIALGAVGMGVVLAWSGIQNQKITTTIQDIVSGKKPKPGPKPPPAPSADISSIQDLTAAQKQALGALGGNPLNPLSPSGLSADKNQAIGKILASGYGWGSGANWDALVTLWNSESSWSNTVWNTQAPCGGGAHAYGIPQACGHGVPSSRVP